MEEATIPGGVIDDENVCGSIEEEARLEESAELGEAELTDGDRINGMPPTNAAGSKLVSNDSSGADSDCEDF